MGGTVRAAVAVACIGTLAACGSNPPTASTASSTTPPTTVAATETTTTTAAAATPTNPPVDYEAVLAGCTPATDNEIALISPSLTGGAGGLAQAFTGYDGTYHYLVANIVDTGGVKMSSSDVWIIEAGAPYALSGSAREFTLLPDGRDLPGQPSAGDEYPDELSKCPLAATIVHGS